MAGARPGQWTLGARRIEGTGDTALTPSNPPYLSRLLKGVVELAWPFP